MSARLASEAFIYIFAKLPLFCWKAVTTAFCLIISVYFYKYALLFKATPSPLLALLNIWQIAKKQTNFYNLLLFAGCFVLLVTVVFLAPDVALRKADDIARYIPDFETVALPLRLQYSIRWIFDAIVNHFGLLLNAIWAVLLIMLLGKNSKRILDWILTAVLIFAEIITLFNESFSGLFNFSAKWV